MRSNDKLRYDLISPIGLRELAYVYTIGAAKHGDNGWLERPMPWSDLVGRIQRHLNVFQMGQLYDKDDGQMHPASIAWAGLALCHYAELGLGEDDRRTRLDRPLTIVDPGVPLTLGTHIQEYVSTVDVVDRHSR